MIEQLRRDGRVERGWLGIAVQDFGNEPGGRRGAQVQAVERGSPGARAGLRQGDILVALNGERMEGSRTLIRNVAGTPPGQTVRLTLIRDGRQQEIAVQVGRRPPSAS
ncbi:S1C family serine protease [Pseudoroseomonas wenyumeiae]